MTMAVPPSIPADGNLRIAWITTYVSGTLLAATLTAGKDLSCYFTTDGWNRALNEASVNDDRLCTTQSGEKPGRYSETLETMYIYDPQDLTPTTNLAYDTLLKGTNGFLVARYGLAFDAAWAAGQKVDVINVVCGQQHKMPPAANDILKVQQKQFIPPAGIVYAQALT